MAGRDLCSMSKECVDGEFWLPSEILCDDFYLAGGGEGRGCGEGSVGFGGGSCVLREFPFGCGSNLDSPVESVTETEESEEDEDYMAGLTQQMAHYFLQDDDKDASAALEKEDSSKGMARSPQSTLCAWSAASNKGSPNGPSVVSSPPSTSPLEQRSKAELCDLLYEAAGQVMRLRINDVGRNESAYDRGILGAPKKPSPAVSSSPKNPSSGNYAANSALTHQQIQAAHFYHLRRQQALKQQKQQQLSGPWGRSNNTARAAAALFSDTRCSRTMDLSPTAWPPLRKTPPSQLQQQPPLPGSGMRAMFLNGAGVRKESAGTGVFLPRTAGNKIEPRKKTGCSTVLVPDRVVQALNLNLEEFAAQPRFPGGFVLSHDALIGRSSAVLSHQKKSHPHHHHIIAQPHTAAAAAAAAAAAVHDMGLPQEWTY